MKKVMAFVSMAMMAVTLSANGATEKATAAPAVDDGKETLELVLMSRDTTNGAFQNWLKTAEEACNLKISVIATPTNSNDRQAKITTFFRRVIKR